MAIEDAVVLAESIASFTDIPQSLAAYSARRFERVKTVYDASLQLCNFERDPVPDAPRAAALLMQTYQYLGQPM